MEMEGRSLDNPGVGKSEHHFGKVLAAGIIVAGSWAMAAVEPGGEMIDSRRFEQAPTQLVTPKPLAIVSEVKGIAQWRSGPQQPWVAVREGVAIDGPAEFRTGPRSKVRLTIRSGETVTIDRLGVIQLEDLIGSGGKVKSPLGIQYRREEFKAEGAGLQRDADIAAPGATLAVRGCWIPWK